MHMRATKSRGLKFSNGDDADQIYRWTEIRINREKGKDEIRGIAVGEYLLPTKPSSSHRMDVFSA